MKDEACHSRRECHCDLTSQETIDLVSFFLVSLKCLPHSRSSGKVLGICKLNK